MDPIASVVIPTYRRPGALDRCLRMILAQQSAGIPYEVIVADDGNDETTRAVAASRQSAAVPVIYVPVTGRHGPAAARNTGWHRTSGQYIAFTDDDCMPSPQWLRAGVKALQRGAAAAWGKTRVPLRPRPTDYEKNAAGLESAGFITANCFVRRDALERINGFDERFLRAWREDTDMFFSLLARHETVVHVPEALVVHPVNPAPWGISIRQQKNNFFDALLFRKHPGLFARHIGTDPPWAYYAIVSSFLLGLIQCALLSYRPAMFFGAVWVGLTLRFFLKRLRGTSHAPRDLLDMVTSSACIPFYAVYWRLKGALTFNVRLL